MQVQMPACCYQPAGCGMLVAGGFCYGRLVDESGIARPRNELRPSSVRHEICAREASEPREGGLSCALGSKLP